MKIDFNDIKLDLNSTKNFGNIQFTPIIMKVKKDTQINKVLYQGLEENKIKIEELDNASVPEVELVNESDEFYLGYKGTIIRGGGQNRQLLHSVVVPGKTSIKIPVQCIQYGRWNPNKEKKFSSKSTDLTSTSLRFKKQTQAQTWDTITHRTTTSRTSTQTQDYTVMHDFFVGDEEDATGATAFMNAHDQQDTNKTKVRDRIQEITNELKTLPNQVGLFINSIEDEKGEIKEVDYLELFSSSKVYENINRSIVSSFALDASMVDTKKIEPNITQRFEKFIKKLEQMDWEKQNSIGKETREEIIENPEKMFGERIFNEDELVHLMCSSKLI